MSVVRPARKFYLIWNKTHSRVLCVPTTTRRASTRPHPLAAIVFLLFAGSLGRRYPRIVAGSQPLSCSTFSRDRNKRVRFRHAKKGASYCVREPCAPVLLTRPRNYVHASPVHLPCGNFLTCGLSRLRTSHFRTVISAMVNIQSCMDGRDVGQLWYEVWKLRKADHIRRRSGIYVIPDGFIEITRDSYTCRHRLQIYTWFL